MVKDKLNGFEASLERAESAERQAILDRISASCDWMSNDELRETAALLENRVRDGISDGVIQALTDTSAA